MGCLSAICQIKSVITPASLAGFESVESVITPLAGFDGARRPPPTRRTHCDPGCFQINACRFSTHTSGLLDAPKRPAEPSQCDDLLFLFFVQDIAHADGAYPAGFNVPNVVIVGRFSADNHWPVLGDR